MKFLIAGLGNIGPEYELTRHNIGFLVVDQLADEHKATFKMDRHAEKAEFKFKGKAIHVIKPTTFMNLSGKAISYWLNDLKIPKENLLVIVDDLAIPFGNLRLRTKGSSAGHNGLNNVETIAAFALALATSLAKASKWIMFSAISHRKNLKNFPASLKKQTRWPYPFAPLVLKEQ